MYMSSNKGNYRFMFDTIPEVHEHLMSKSYTELISIIGALERDIVVFPVHNLSLIHLLKIAMYSSSRKGNYKVFGVTFPVVYEHMNNIGL